LNINEVHYKIEVLICCENIKDIEI
jgi:hypothetical protein